MAKRHFPRQLFPEEGRLIDGFWTPDRYLLAHHGKWVCSWPCYVELLTRVTVPTISYEYERR